MGASASSTRRLTVKNDAPRIVQVTEDVANRIMSFPPRPPPPPPLASADFSDISDENVEPLAGSAVPEETSSSSRGAQTVGVLNLGPSGQPVVETVSAYQVRQQKEREIRQNDQLWLAKLRDLESRYVASAFASQEEFGTELEKLQKIVPKKRSVPCTDLSSKVAECYSLNPTQPLRCSEEVKSFAQCVERSRAA